jgi:N-hydroxyarylamine O-acetyltransferase
MDVNAYLDRINYTGALAPSAETLRGLHVAHLMSVPFENLDIPLRRPIVLDEAALFNKIVERRRGGFCYELNGLFACLLRELGFNVQMLSAGVMGRDGQFGPDFDHMTLLVTLEQRWLADVGFGDSFREPILLDERCDQPQDGRAYRLDQDISHLILMQRERDGNWEAQYRFTLQPRQLADYQEMCLFQQTSPQSSFTQRRICTRATPEGRITLSDMRLITTVNGTRTERTLADPAEYARMLHEHFAIDLNFP